MTPQSTALRAAREALQLFLDWGSQQCPCKDETPDPCPLCGASVAEGTCKAVESKFPQRILVAARNALALGTDAGQGDAGEWRPIETAPKDGSRIILWWGEVSRIGYWLDNSKTATPWQGWRTPSMEPMPLGQPTHWMPMPSAPGAAAPSRAPGADPADDLSYKPVPPKIVATYAIADPASATMSQLAHRVMTWPLPVDLGSDMCAVSGIGTYGRSGTNLMTHAQAEAMLRHVLCGAAPVRAPSAEAARDEIMQAAMNMAHIYSFVGDDSLPIAKRALESAVSRALGLDTDNKDESK